MAADGDEHGEGAPQPAGLSAAQGCDLVTEALPASARPASTTARQRSTGCTSTARSWGSPHSPSRASRAGGNLALATAIRAKREGRLAAVDGVYALAPFISGLYGSSAEEREAALPSLVENDGYFMACDGTAIFAEVYDPGAEHATDPLCWPYHATVEDLSGLPPHAISVNELDPLRDEGLVYHRRLVEAGSRPRHEQWPGRATQAI
ncbi:alpha/beta hydrolase fold domain-containing protein [Streptomyces sp. NPDC020125]|uniref:alpha/beta hydrolase fold domain-containing protein n=1 Tax=Streptomyces sp. NPDC020125 TaxID=3154593 RepID=UPI00340F597D